MLFIYNSIEYTEQRWPALHSTLSCWVTVNTDLKVLLPKAERMLYTYHHTHHPTVRGGWGWRGLKAGLWVSSINYTVRLSKNPNPLAMLRPALGFWTFPMCLHYCTLAFVCLSVWWLCLGGFEPFIGVDALSSRGEPELFPVCLSRHCLGLIPQMGKPM